MDRVYEYTPLKLELLELLESTISHLENSSTLLDDRLQNVNSNINDLDSQIEILREKLDNISQIVNDENYQAQVFADTLQVKLRKSIVTIIDTESEDLQPDLSEGYSELLDPEDEYYGFSNGSAWFILES